MSLSHITLKILVFLNIFLSYEVCIKSVDSLNISKNLIFV